MHLEDVGRGFGCLRQHCPRHRRNPRGHRPGRLLHQHPSHLPQGEDLQRFGHQQVGAFFMCPGVITRM